MRRLLGPEARSRASKAVEKVRLRFNPWVSKASSRWADFDFREKIARRFNRQLPPFAITHIQPPALLVLMGGTTVSQYDEVGQIGRLAASLERHARFFRTVILMTPDRTDYTERLGVERVHHIRLPFPVPLTRTAPLLASVLFRSRTVRRVTSVLVMDETAAPAGWLASRLSRATLSMSVGAPWAPPRDPATSGRGKWLVRAGLKRVEQVVAWPHAAPVSEAVMAEPSQLPELVDTDLFCPLTTTDPTRPRTVGVFVSSDHEADARVIMGVAERLVRRRQDAVMRAFVIGQAAEARAASLQSEASERGLIVEFQQLPVDEMAPDAIAHMRMCVSFTDPDSARYLLRAMASGVPVIAVGPGPADTETGGDSTGWTRFVLSSGPTEEQVTRSIEALFREPGIRLRMAREGRRFVVARHSLDAISAIESKLLRGADDFTFEAAEETPEFNADAAARELVQMLGAAGVERADADGDPQPEAESAAAA